MDESVELWIYREDEGRVNFKKLISGISGNGEMLDLNAVNSTGTYHSHMIIRSPCVFPINDIKSSGHVPFCSNPQQVQFHEFANLNIHAHLSGNPYRELY